jgi:hypothetical protein
VPYAILLEYSTYALELLVTNWSTGVGRYSTRKEVAGKTTTNSTKYRYRVADSDSGGLKRNFSAPCTSLSLPTIPSIQHPASYTHITHPNQNYSYPLRVYLTSNTTLRLLLLHYYYHHHHHHHHHHFHHGSLQLHRSPRHHRPCCFVHLGVGRRCS